MKMLGKNYNGIQYNHSTNLGTRGSQPGRSVEQETKSSNESTLVIRDEANG